MVEIIENKERIQNFNKNYNDMNNKLLNFNPQNIKEIIQENYPPSTYSQIHYPDIQYFNVTKILSMNLFIEKFNSSEENKKKYALINMLINKDSDVTKNAMKLQNLIPINKLVNLLINIYSYKISRDEAKQKKLKDEIPYIVEQINNMGNILIDNNDSFIGEYIMPFIDSWSEIKKNSVQYKCRVLRDLEKGQKPYEITIDNLLCDFLVDDGDKEGGMFLAAAYQYLIECQNSFINNIISKNNIKGVLNSYISQLEQTINIQDATPNEIININDDLFNYLDDLITANSFRNIFDKKTNTINYKNYSDIIYNFDIIEEELGKKILPGLKKFTNEKIKFVVYKFEEFRGENSSVLLDYNTKYIQKDLEECEKEALNEFLQTNNGSRFYTDVFSSLQLLMKEIIKENYGQNKSLAEIIDNLPRYIQLNEKLVDFFRKQIYGDVQLFTVNTLVTIFDYFESLCWNDIKKNIPPDFTDTIPENIHKEILSFFEQKNVENRIITKENLTSAIRKLISRSISGTRQEIEIKTDAKLKIYIEKEDIWNKSIIEKDGFNNEIDEIFKSEILVAQIVDLYNLLDGDNILYDKLNKNKAENKNENINLDKKGKEKKRKEKEKEKEKEEEEEEGEKEKEEEREEEKEEEINTNSKEVKAKEEKKDDKEKSGENEEKEDSSDEENENSEETSEFDDREGEI